MRKDISARRNPLMKGEATLDFGLEAEEDIAITDEQKTDAFMSKWMDVVDPFVRYKKYFESAAKDDAHILLEVKRYYRKLVIDGSWTEKKYVAVVNDCMNNNMTITPVTLDVKGRMYDDGKMSTGARRSGSGNRNTGRRR